MSALLSPAFIQTSTAAAATSAGANHRTRVRRCRRGAATGSTCAIVASSAWQRAQLEACLAASRCSVEVSVPSNHAATTSASRHAPSGSRGSARARSSRAMVSSGSCFTASSSYRTIRNGLLAEDVLKIEGTRIRCGGRDGLFDLCRGQARAFHAALDCLT